MQLEKVYDGKWSEGIIVCVMSTWLVVWSLVSDALFSGCLLISNLKGLSLCYQQVIFFSLDLSM